MDHNPLRKGTHLHSEFDCSGSLYIIMVIIILATIHHEGLAMMAMAMMMMVVGKRATYPFRASLYHSHVTLTKKGSLQIYRQVVVLFFYIPLFKYDIHCNKAQHLRIPITRSKLNREDEEEKRKPPYTHTQ